MIFEEIAMIRFPLILATISLVGLPALAQPTRVPPPPNPNPTSSAEVLNEPVLNPIRNTPAGMTPLTVPGEPVRIQPDGIVALQACQARMLDTGALIDSWRPGPTKTNALLELRAARIAALSGDPRTCEAHVDTARMGR
jgi:hypothetical protein